MDLRVLLHQARSRKCRRWARRALGSHKPKLHLQEEGWPRVRGARRECFPVQQTVCEVLGGNLADCQPMQPHMRSRRRCRSITATDLGASYGILFTKRKRRNATKGQDR